MSSRQRKPLPVIDRNPLEVSDEELEALDEAVVAKDRAARAEEYEAQAQGQSALIGAMAAQTYSPPNKVACPLPGFEGMEVTYDLTQPYKRRFAMPQFQSTRKAGEDYLDDPDTLSRDFELYVKRLSKWALLFVKEIEGWPEVLDAEGAPITNPAIDGWRSFYALWMSRNDVASWIANDGYERAMGQALGNSRSR